MKGMQKLPLILNQSPVTLYHRQQMTLNNKKIE